MIYVTGDTHGTRDCRKLRKDSWPDGQRLTRDDYLIICGDFGGLWDGDTRDRELLSWYESQPWTTLWVDGNHENHNLIDSMSTTTRFGGRVHVEPAYPHVIHLMRGEVYDLPATPSETVRAFVMGGAPSIDLAWRTEGVNWWAREMPDDEEYYTATENLRACDWAVDYVFTHEVPEDALDDALEWSEAAWEDEPEENELMEFLQDVDNHLDKDRLRMWYAGHYHVDCTVMDEQHCVLYEQIVPLGEGPS